MIEPLLNTYTNDESTENGPFAKPPTTGPVSIILAAHVAGAAPASAIARTELLHADEIDGPFELVPGAWAEAAGPGSHADIVVHVSGNDLKPHLRPRTWGAGGDPDGAGSVYLVY